MPIQLLEKQLDWASNFADFVSLDEIISVRNPDRWKIAVTLDDGYRNNLSLALPVFERFEVPVTWFVSTKFVKSDELPWWDLVDFVLHEAQPTLRIETKDTQYFFDLSMTQDQTHFQSKCRNWFQKASLDVASHVRTQIESSIDEELPQNAFASQKEVIEASQSPLLTLGGHTVSHPNLACLPAPEARREIREGKETLEMWANQSIRWFAYPYGGREHRTDRTKEIVQEEGFEGAVTTDRAYADEGNDRFQVPRLTVPNSRSLWKTKAWILATNTFRELYRLKENIVV